MFSSVLHGFFLFSLHSDEYNGVPALDPEKLKIFNTVREITGACKCVYVCVYVNF